MMTIHAAGPLAGCLVLLVEDDPADADLYTESLVRAGAEVSRVADGPAAVVALRAGRRYHVCVVDLVLPGTGGTELVAAIRAGGFRGALVGLSAFLTDEVTERWYAAGCDAVLTKDTPRDAFLRTVASVCQTFDRA